MAGEKGSYAQGEGVKPSKYNMLSFNFFSQKLLFLRYLPYMVNVTPRNATGHGRGEGEMQIPLIH